MSLIKKPVLWNCVLQVQLYISLPHNIFEAFLQKQNHSLVPLIFNTINHKRYLVQLFYATFQRNLLQGNTKENKKYRYFNCIKNPKNRCSDLMFSYFFPSLLLHNICMRDINLVD